MAAEKWNEEGRDLGRGPRTARRGAGGQCERADVAEPLRSPVPTRMISNGEYMPVAADRQAEAGRGADRRTRRRGEQEARHQPAAVPGRLGRHGGRAARHERGVRAVLQRRPDRAVRTGGLRRRPAPPKDLFVFDDQLHLVRGSRPSPADLRAIAQGPSSAPTVKSNPFNPRGQRDERGDAWGVWNPALVGLPIDPGYAHITQFIKDVYLDSQVTIGLLSNVTASMVQVDGRAAAAAAERRGGPARRDPHGRPDRRRAELRQRDLRLHAHALPRPALRRQGQPAVHPGADRPERAGLVEGLQHLQLRQGGRRPEQPHAAVAARRRGGGVPDVRADPEELRAAQGQEAGVQQHLRPQGPGPRPAGSEARPSGRPAQGGARLAEAQLHHLSRLHPAELLPGRHAGGGQGGQAARRRAGHQLDDGVRPARAATCRTATPRSARRGRRRW